MKKNKIIHIISGLRQGGAEHNLFNLILNSKKSFDSIVIALSTNGYYYNKLKNKNVIVYEIDFKKKIYFFFNLFKLIIIIRNYNPNLIQTWMYHANFISIFIKLFFINKPIIWNLRNSNLKFKTSKKFTIFVNYFSSIFSKFIPNTIISCSKKITDYHINIGYDKKKIINIGNGFDQNVFYYNKKWRIKYRKFLNIDKKTKFIGFINRYDDQKNFDTFLKILYHLKKINFQFKAILCGEFVDLNNNKLINKIKFYNLSNCIILAGSRKNMQYLYSALDYSISTSLYGEGFQNTLLESIATETLPLFSKAGDAEFILKNLLETFNGNNHDEYVRFITKYDNLSFKEKSKIIKSLKTLSYNYTLDKMYLQYKNIYEKFI